MRLWLNNSQTFLHRDYIINSLLFFMQSKVYDNFILKDADIKPFSIGYRVSIIVPVLRDDVNKIASSRPTYALVADETFGFGNGDQCFFYYVDKVVTKSNNAIQLDMTLDVKNTLFSNDADYVNGVKNFYTRWKNLISERSFINRCHIDRFYNHQQYDSSTHTATLMPFIDRTDEGLQTTLRSLQLSKVRDMVDDSRYYLAFGESYWAKNAEGTLTRYYSPLRAYLFRENTDIQAVTLKDDSFDLAHIPTTPTYERATIKSFASLPVSASTFVKVLELPYCPSTKTQTSDGALKMFTDSDVFKAKDYDGNDIPLNPDRWHVRGFGRNAMAWQGGDHTGNEFREVEKYQVETLSTDAPYLPYSVTLVGDLSQLGYINDSRGYPLPRFVNSDLESIAILKKFTINTATSPYALPKGSLEDPKMYNSNFYQVRFIYDNNVFFFPLEYCQPSFDGINVHPVFKVSNSMNSEFMFEFSISTQWVYDGAFQNYFIINRNVEHTVYNSKFVDYMQSGINYDRKANAIASKSAVLNATTSLATGLSRSIITGALVNPIGGTTSAISSGVGAVTSLINSVNQQDSRNNSIQAKIANASSGCASVAGSSDVDMLNEYCPKLLYGTYQVTDKVDSIKDLFYYFGYAQNKLGRPTSVSRCWFNYVQFDAVYAGLPLWVDLEMRNALSEDFHNGVTIFHNRGIEYSFDFTKENIEMALVNSQDITWNS